jgi:hypothetical protein
MPRYSIPIGAGAEVRLPYPGKMVQVVDTGAASSVNLTIEWGDQQNAENIGAVYDSFKIKSDRPFSGLIISTAVGCTVDLIISLQDISLESTRGSAPGLPMYVSGLILGDTPAAAHANGAPIACGAAAVAILAANANRLEYRATNNGADPVAIGAPGITWANRALILAPGDTWIETKGAALAWEAICDAAKTASLNIQELTA